MNETASYAFFILIVVYSLSIAFGINIKKWHGWVQVLSGFLLGLLMGQNSIGKLTAGIFFALMAVILGPIAWKRRNL